MEHSDNKKHSLQSNIELPSPSPGLRPFDYSNSQYFFGRERQINEIIGRLDDHHLITVMGLSGCGKSSLIKAGVIPNLLQNKIKSAGDYWQPIEFKPGTNYRTNQRADTPYVRLVDSFIPLINTDRVIIERDDIDSISDIRNRMATLLDGIHGLNDLVEEFQHYLLQGSDERVNFLFIFDQFEELFHRSNMRDSDIKKIFYNFVEKLLYGHFKHPHPNIYVIITMRSEYINDCTRFLSLPTIINDTAYLLGRLNLRELKTAVEMPFQFQLTYMKMHALNNNEPLPKNIDFSTEAWDILDKAITEYNEKDDQLPLLQHFVFRLWRVIDEYFHNESDVFYIQPTHLFEAAKCNKDSDARKNLLKQCLNNWAESYYRKLTDAGIEENNIDNFLFVQVQKDHRGYNQSRVNKSEITDLTGLDQNEFDTLLETFTNPHHYFDIDDKGNVKVSHEAFIRSWKRFRKLADIEARDFETYEDIVIKKYLPKESKIHKEDIKYYESSNFLNRLENQYYEKNLALNFDKNNLSENLTKQDTIISKLVKHGISEYIDKSKTLLIKEDRWKRIYSIGKYILFLLVVLVVVGSLIGYKISIENSMLNLFTENDIELSESQKHVQELDVDPIRDVIERTEVFNELSNKLIWDYLSPSPKINLKHHRHKFTQVFQAKLNNKKFIYPKKQNEFLSDEKFDDLVVYNNIKCIDDDSEIVLPESGTVIKSLQNHITQVNFGDIVPVFFLSDNDPDIKITPGVVENGICTIYSSKEYILSDFISELHPKNPNIKNIQIFFNSNFSAIYFHYLVEQAWGFETNLKAESGDFVHIVHPISYNDFKGNAASNEKLIPSISRDNKEVYYLRLKDNASNERNIRENTTCKMHDKNFLSKNCMIEIAETDYGLLYKLDDDVFMQKMRFTRYIKENSYENLSKFMPEKGIDEWFKKNVLKHDESAQTFSDSFQCERESKKGRENEICTIGNGDFNNGWLYSKNSGREDRISATPITYKAVNGLVNEFISEYFSD